MIKKLFDQIVDAVSAPAADNEEDREHAIRMATAVLMIDVARADDTFDEAEFDRVLSLTEKHFELAAEDAAALVNSANETAESIVSLHGFTDTLHANLQEHEKARIVEMLWKVAYADGDLDKYENSLVLKISDLLHVSRGAVMRLKHDAASQP
jgi:uncharacterized tellurite resistance protein B-like protein